MSKEKDDLEVSIESKSGDCVLSYGQGRAVIKLSTMTALERLWTAADAERKEARVPGTTMIAQFPTQFVIFDHCSKADFDVMREEFKKFELSPTYRPRYRVTTSGFKTTLVTSTFLNQGVREYQLAVLKRAACHKSKIRSRLLSVDVATIE